ncbi:hypothetical protein NB723_001665 [Xanthomonas sacchari]|nr:hypothetical protein [Xanthomonas sacchari]
MLEAARQAQNEAAIDASRENLSSAITALTARGLGADPDQANAAALRTAEYTQPIWDLAGVAMVQRNSQTRAATKRTGSVRMRAGNAVSMPRLKDAENSQSPVNSDFGHSSYQYELLKRDLLRQEIQNPGDLSSGPVVLRNPVAGASQSQIQQIRDYADISNLSINEGYMSPTGRVSTQGALRNAASYAAAAERAAAAAAGRPYVGVVGHGPDTTWTGKPVAPFWLDIDSSINSSLGRQAQDYPLGYRPTRFIYEGDLNWTGNVK